MSATSQGTNSNDGLAEAWKRQAKEGRMMVLPSEPQHGWQSVPSFVRLAVWLWAIAVVLGVAGGLVVGVFTLLALAIGMSS